MADILLIILSAVAVMGASAAALQKDPYDKLISLGILFAGIIPFIAAAGFLDVAIALSLSIPMTTIILLNAVRRCTR